VQVKADIPTRPSGQLTQAEKNAILAALEATDIADMLKRMDATKWAHLDSVLDTIVINHNV